MSTTDRAFIKAFARQQSDASAGRKRRQTPNCERSRPGEGDSTAQRRPEDIPPGDARGSADPARDQPATVYARHAAGQMPPAPHFDPAHTGARNVVRPLSHFSRGDAVDEDFQPAVRVESFTWPGTCRRLVRQMPNAWDGVVSRLLEQNPMRGSQVVGIAGCRRGAGCTTVLLCLAKRLTELGVSIAMVDADLGRPDLARQLAVAVQSGWDDVLRDGLPLRDVMVESRSDRAVLLPTREPMPAAQQGTGGLPASISLGVLRRHYRLVLVDLGPLLDVPYEPLAMGLIGQAGIDSVLLVHDVRQPNEVDRLQATSRLHQAGTTVIGITETFAAVDRGGVAANPSPT